MFHDNHEAKAIPAQEGWRVLPLSKRRRVAARFVDNISTQNAYAEETENGHTVREQNRKLNSRWQDDSVALPART